jgi:hypothetical protein
MSQSVSNLTVDFAKLLLDGKAGKYFNEATFAPDGIHPHEAYLKFNIIKMESINSAIRFTFIAEDGTPLCTLEQSQGTSFDFNRGDTITLRISAGQMKIQMM